VFVRIPDFLRLPERLRLIEEHPGRSSAPIFQPVQNSLVLGDAIQGGLPCSVCHRRDTLDSLCYLCSGLFVGCIGDLNGVLCAVTRAFSIRHISKEACLREMRSDHFGGCSANEGGKRNHFALLSNQTPDLKGARFRRAAGTRRRDFPDPHQNDSRTG
jgi:hypothetical protein